MNDIVTPYVSEKWPNFVKKMSSKWLVFNRNWLSYKRPLHVVFYDDVKTDMKTELTAMLHFLGYPTKYLHCALNNADGNFHRKKPKTTEELYDKTLREMIDPVKKEIYSIASKQLAVGDTL